MSFQYQYLTESMFNGEQRDLWRFDSEYRIIEYWHPQMLKWVKSVCDIEDFPRRDWITEQRAKEIEPMAF